MTLNFLHQAYSDRNDVKILLVLWPDRNDAELNYNH